MRAQPSLVVTKNLALRLGLWFPFSILAVACASTEKAAQLQPDHYILESGPVIVSSHPFPNQHPIYANIYSGSTLLKKQLAFRGWDMDYDGKIDMLEYLDESGQVIRTSYDFDRDGTVEADKR